MSKFKCVLSNGETIDSEFFEEKVSKIAEKDDDFEEGEPTEAEAEDESVVVTIAGETPPQEDDEENDRAPEWVRDLRKQYREEKRRNRELEEKLAAASGGSSEAVQLAEKPTLEKADYDTDRYEQELAAAAALQLPPVDLFGEPAKPADDLPPQTTMPRLVRNQSLPL